MSNCDYDVGDQVEAAPGVCGTVIGKNQVGSAWVLQVQLNDGSVVPLDCSLASPCTAVAAAAALPPRCGKTTRAGHPCTRRVSQAGDRCWQHQNKT